MEAQGLAPWDRRDRKPGPTLCRPHRIGEPARVRTGKLSRPQGRSDAIQGSPSAGADRLHGTALGIGERVGNTAIDLLLVNMKLLGWIDRDLSRLPAYCGLVAEATNTPLDDDYPVMGKDAFRTGTGVHAAAVIKAQQKGDDWLADRIYSGVPASFFGRRQIIEVGPMSGESNIPYWLGEQGVEAKPDLVQAIFHRAKESLQVLSDEEVLTLCREQGART